MAKAEEPKSKKTPNNIRWICRTYFDDGNFEGTLYKTKAQAAERCGQGCTQIKVELDGEGIPHRVEGDADEDGWIDHNGGECPVPASTVGVVQFRNESRVTAETRGTRRLGQWRWPHTGGGADIIAYRVVR